MSKVKKALPRVERGYPQTYRVYSSFANPEQMAQSDVKCWVPMSDVVKLERRYYKLFKRYVHCRVECKERVEDYAALRRFFKRYCES